MRYVNFASHPSIRIKKIIFVNAIIIPNGTGKDCQYVLNEALSFKTLGALHALADSFVYKLGFEMS